MIFNELSSSKATMVDTIRQSALQFYLTGSRFFGNEIPESDWDFFARETPGLSEWLRTRNFIRQGCYYGPGMGASKPEEFMMDLTVAEVWQFSSQKDSQKIHIQVIKSEMMWVKVKAQEIIKTQNLMRLAPRCKDGNYKSLSRAIWISVMKTVQLSGPVNPAKRDYTKYYSESSGLTIF